MARNIVVIGGGPAGVFAAIEAKKRDASAAVTLVTEEASEPYEKPPLSKAVLLGKVQPEDAPIAGPGGVAKHGVMLKINARCTEIDRSARKVVAGGERLPYDALLLATGSRMRELALLPPGMPRVHYLRTDEQARMLKADLTRCKQLVVIGAGLIGLEVAASAAELGIQVTVIEFAPRIMGRACDEDTAAAILSEHQRRSVEVEVSTAVTQVTPQLDGSIALETNTGDIFAADIVVVGVGVLPDTALAEAAGLRVLDGIVVDAQCRTSDLEHFRGRRLHASLPGRMGWSGWRTGGMRKTMAPLPAATRRARAKPTTPRRHSGPSSMIFTSRASAGPIRPRKKSAGRWRARARCCWNARMACCATRSASTHSATSPPSAD